MTEFEKVLYERLNSAKKEGEEDIKKKIVKGLEMEFKDLTPRYIAPETEPEPLVAETIWIFMSESKGTQKQYKLTFASKEIIFGSYEEVEKFAKEIINLFPSKHISCYILNTLEWQKTHTIGSRVFGLEFSLNINSILLHGKRDSLQALGCQLKIGHNMK